MLWNEAKRKEESREGGFHNHHGRTSIAARQLEQEKMRRVAGRDYEVGLFLPPICGGKVCDIDELIASLPASQDGLGKTKRLVLVAFFTIANNEEMHWGK